MHRLHHPQVSQYLGQMNDELDAVLNTMLEKDPNNRYQSARAFKLALEKAINSESPQERFEPHAIPYHPEQVKIEKISTGYSYI